MLTSIYRRLRYRVSGRPRTDNRQFDVRAGMTSMIFTLRCAHLRAREELRRARQSVEVLEHGAQATTSC